MFFNYLFTNVKTYCRKMHKEEVKTKARRKQNINIKSYTHKKNKKKNGKMEKWKNSQQCRDDAKKKYTKATFL